MKATMEEFEKARHDAKTIRDKFLKVKLKRYDRFTKAYSHISSRIDEIYKELTRSQMHPLGGTAYLTVENNEVYLDELLYSMSLTLYFDMNVQYKTIIDPYSNIKFHYQHDPTLARFQCIFMFINNSIRMISHRSLIWKE
jgi:hypothetical protein